MLSVNRTEQAVADYEGHDFNPEAAESRRLSLDARITFSPVIEMFGDKGDGMAVADAAKVYRKSPRQIQRLLKSGRLVGYKVDGPKGLEWRVSREQPVVQNVEY